MARMISGRVYLAYEDAKLYLAALVKKHGGSWIRCSGLYVPVTLPPKGWEELRRQSWLVH